MTWCSLACHSPIKRIFCLKYNGLIFLQYEKALRAGVNTAQQILANEDINVIFFRISEICTMHTDFVNELKPVLENWTPSQAIGLHFKMLVR